MHKRCSGCGLQFERESGFFLGAIYFNYGLTALIVTVAFMVLTITQAIPRNQIMAGTLTFSILFPILFFRHARSLWLGFDFMIDPRATNEETGSEWHETMNENSTPE